jgi:penicillin amidase
MLPALLAFALAQPSTPNIPRDEYGVPHIVASTWEDAFFQCGYAVAQDRLWQMENSRRLAEGRMSAVYGKQFLQSDREVLSFAYTDEELHQQFAALSAQAQSAITNYAKGVNAYIQAATQDKSLPAEYGKYSLAPEPWRVEDSVAVGVRLFQLFGRGGAGELRNLALLTYLQSQPNAKAKVQDIIDDLAWQNDPSAMTTLSRADDPLAKNPPLSVAFTRADTERQLAHLPKLNLFELLPGINLASRQESTRVAERMNVPYKTGSYCVVVGPQRSAIGAPLLLSGPQMGFTTPSIIHEMSIDAPGVKVVGMDVPGVPGVVLGYTPNVAWGLTSGVADTEDIFDFEGEGANAMKYGKDRKLVKIVPFTLKVKGQPDEMVDQLRTDFGPVALHVKDHYFVRRSTYRGVEMKSYDALMGLYAAKSPAQVEDTISKASMNFNFFYAMPSGDFGFRYLGLIPVRAPGVDPRFPTPGEPENDWRGYLPASKMPSSRNPSAGFLANWNNKPVAWWPNYDTPVWGRIFRNEVLLDQLQKPKLSIQDLELAAWTIARTDETSSYFRPLLAGLHGTTPLESQAAAYLKGFDGRLQDGSISAAIYAAFFEALRPQIFLGTTGNFMAPDFFRLAAQPSTMLRALSGKTKVNYLGSRTAAQVVQAAFQDAVKTLSASKGPDVSLWRYRTGGIGVPGEPRIPYSNRGSFIQLVELLGTPSGRDVLTPGVAESGSHSKDQVPLARSWTYKRMSWGEGRS